MTNFDPLYFPRTDLANRLLIGLKDGITHALTLFAPRRMGKTQFLLNDIKPTAETMGFNVFYFSFMEQDAAQIAPAFTAALTGFLGDITHHKHKLRDTLKAVERVDVLGVGVALKGKTDAPPLNLAPLLNELAQVSTKPILLLLDEVQELARGKSNDGMVRALRTGLDTNQHKIKVIFTGSSTNGLKTMFNDNKAPFFHFAHALNFPNLGREFTDFLAEAYHQRTGKRIDNAEFYRLFERFHFTPLYMRSIAQDMIINPDLSLEQAAAHRLSQMSEQGDMVNQWQQLTLLERQLLIQIAAGNTTPYGKASREALAALIGVDNLTASQIQGKLRKLARSELITRSLSGAWQINSPHLQTWIAENQPLETV